MSLFYLVTLDLVTLTAVRLYPAVKLRL